MNMNVLVVGGCGYLGGAVLDLLMLGKHRLRVYDALLYEESYRKPVEFIFGDVCDPKQLRPHLKWADAVIWLAALVGDGACALNPEITVAINQEAVRSLAEQYDGRIVFVSTCSVYGAQDELLDEDAPTNPLSLYAKTKLAAESYLKHSNAIIFRLGTLFGVGDVFSRIRLDLVVNTLTARAYRHGRITLYGGEQFRPLLHVRDAARAVADSLVTPHTGVFNLHWENMRVTEIAERVRVHFPDVIVERRPIPPQDMRNYRVSSEKARRLLGFHPTRTVDDGILELKELLSSFRVRDPANPRYTNEAFLAMYHTHRMIANGIGSHPNAEDQRELQPSVAAS